MPKMPITIEFVFQYVLTTKNSIFPVLEGRDV